MLVLKFPDTIFSMYSYIHVLRTQHEKEVQKYWQCYLMRMGSGSYTENFLQAMT